MTKPKTVSEREVFVACHEPTGLGVAGACVKMVGTVADVWAKLKAAERATALHYLAAHHGRLTCEAEYIAAWNEVRALLGMEPET